MLCTFLLNSYPALISFCTFSNLPITFLFSVGFVGSNLRGYKYEKTGLKFEFQRLNLNFEFVSLFPLFLCPYVFVRGVCLNFPNRSSRVLCRERSIDAAESLPG